MKNWSLNAISMKAIINVIKRINLFFSWLQELTLFKAIEEIFFISLISFIPLLLAISIEAYHLESLKDAFLQKIFPSEILAYCVSFMSTIMYFIMKRFFEKNNTRLPLGKFYFLFSIIIYIVCIYILVAIKNNYDPILKNTFNSEGNLNYILYLLLIIICFRIYSVYHNTRPSNHKDILEEQQDQLNNKLTKALNGNDRY